MSGSYKRMLWEALIIAPIATILAIGASYLIPGDITTLESVAPETKTSDFCFSDFYSIAVSNDKTYTIDPNITIVAVDRCSRTEIAAALATADSAGAKAIGIDLILEKPTVDYDSLADYLRYNKRIILPVLLKDYDGIYFNDAEASYFDTWEINDSRHASININGSHEGCTTRYFKPEFDHVDSPIPSMAMMLAETYKPGSFDRIMTRGNSMEMIDFTTHQFNVIHAKDLYRHTDLLKNKIVLLGCVDNAADKHRIPLINNMAGVIIHAYIISTIINDDFIDDSSWLINMTIAAIVRLIIVFLGVLFRSTDWGCMMVRILQIAILFTILYIGTALFRTYHYNLDFGPTILISVLGLLVMDILIGLNAIIRHIIIRFRRRISPTTPDCDHTPQQ